MNLQELREYCQFRLNKDQAGNTLSSKEYDRILKIVSLEYFKSQLGLDVVSPISQRIKGFQVTQMLTENTRHLIVNKGLGNVPIDVSASGILVLPEDYFTYTEINYLYLKNSEGEILRDHREIEILSDNEWSGRVGSTLMAPTAKDPIGRFISESRIEVRPLSIRRANLSYLRYPTAPVYAYTLDDDDNEVYDSANSTELDWPEITHPDIANLIIGYASDNLRDQFTKQSAEVRKQKGE